LSNQVTFIFVERLGGHFFLKNQMRDYLKERLSQFPEGFPRMIATWVYKFLEKTGEMDSEVNMVDVGNDQLCCGMLDLNDISIACLHSPIQGTFLKLDDFLDLLRSHCKWAFDAAKEDIQSGNLKEGVLDESFELAIKGFHDLFNTMAKEAKYDAISRN